jgi:hypothetical protein
MTFVPIRVSDHGFVINSAQTHQSIKVDDSIYKQIMKSNSTQLVLQIAAALSFNLVIGK